MLHLSLPDTVATDSSFLHADQSHSHSLNACSQNEEGSLSKVGTSDEPQLSAQDSKSQNNPELPPVSTMYIIFIVQFQEISIVPRQKRMEFPKGWGGGGCIKPKHLKKSMKLNGSFLRAAFN